MKNKICAKIKMEPEVEPQQTQDQTSQGAKMGLVDTTVKQEVVQDEPKVVYKTQVGTNIGLQKDNGPFENRWHRERLQGKPVFRSKWAAGYPPFPHDKNVYGSDKEEGNEGEDNASDASSYPSDWSGYSPQSD
jgi:hypothetical protein